MKAAELVCVNCKNWQSERCGDCPTTYWHDLSNGIDSIVFEQYVHTFITPEEYEKRTGKKWIGAVWSINDPDIKKVFEYSLLNERMKEKTKGKILVCNGPEVPGYEVPEFDAEAAKSEAGTARCRFCGLAISISTITDNKCPVCRKDNWEARP
jgi:hypothetical protein